MKEFTNMVMSIHFIIVNLEILLFSYLSAAHFVLHELTLTSKLFIAMIFFYEFIT